jgi:hypothetical protein
MGKGHKGRMPPAHKTYAKDGIPRRWIAFTRRLSPTAANIMETTATCQAANLKRPPAIVSSGIITEHTRIPPTQPLQRRRHDSITDDDKGGPSDPITVQPIHFATSCAARPRRDRWA